MEANDQDKLISQFASLLKDKKDKQKVDIESTYTKEVKDWKTCMIAKVHTHKKVSFVGLKESLLKA